ncbi:acyl-ACP--UDP-N-acetylglucosamine O-acyltransferase [Sediminicurvatus halobius]|uniref:Acyl-[acyl-carrier-protein]--UDP-N-acetylglucosamine O-acyltransferase n=1 Tax=Sediminicurvatus halobius TaxID=2182432 RepID=A0A2U2N3X9_9GAMM|nr:acyl-ACP--UDP-N-acetylglucosamine O-acyltransferase [Spiribacter halobius]PWG63921.1 acyl-[acyl-carrier-protein]--UDP-N-acetylglucosamine O-acyltransferase [Spiribacter halobius]
MIHDTAVIDPEARLGRNVRVGAYAVIGAGVTLGDGCEVGPHAVLEGPATLGPGNRLAAHAVLGLPPQDTGYAGEPTRLEIGARNVFREFVTVHRGTPKDRGVTRIGDDNLFMAYTHLGHDGDLGSRVTIANGSQLAGHVHVGDQAYISAVCGVHQFVRIGRNAMLGGGAVVTQDVAPYVTVAGNRARLHGLNSRGLRRAGLSLAAQQAIRGAYRLLFREGLRLEEALARIEADPALDLPEIAELVTFVRQSRRGLIR